MIDRPRVRDAAESVRRDVQRRRHIEILESSVGDPSLNIFGRVAFTGKRFDENFNQIFSINTSWGGAVTTVVESSPGGYSSFREPSLNDLGNVAFTADVQLR